MLANNMQNTFQFPEKITIIGGGRWARVMIDVLCAVMPQKMFLKIHSIHNSKFMLEWVKSKVYNHDIEVSDSLPNYSEFKPDAVIVVNAAKDHEMAVEHALKAFIPVLVEKPMALNAVSSKRLVDLAFKQNTMFCTSHIFLFANYMEKFIQYAKELKNIRNINVVWTDPKSEERYGEQKQFDEGLPIFIDWLPHILSIINSISTSNQLFQCKEVDFSKGGAALKLSLKLGEISCEIQLERNSYQRKRIVEVLDVNGEKVQLDFTNEPGNIIYNNVEISDSFEWSLENRPVAKTLTSFLKGVSSDVFDNRLNNIIGLNNSLVIDDILKIYRKCQKAWVNNKLSDIKSFDKDIYYAITEIIKSDGYFLASK